MLELIKELAEYEKAPNEVTNTLEMMERDGFGGESIFGFFVAEVDSEIVGMALFYWRYSTWKGKRLYLEDIIVSEKERGRGIGKDLFERVMRHAVEKNCTGMMWQVLNWNDPAINFYKKFPTKFDKGWINCSLEVEDILRVIH